MTKIMLVEDDKSLREIYAIRLVAEGYDIVSANDGEEALAMAIKEQPVLVISDVMMPKISGFDMLDILRSTPDTKDMKVIMMTALSNEDQRQRGEKLGADRYLVKSQVGIEDVIAVVHEVLDDRGEQQPATDAAAQSATPTPIAENSPVAAVQPTIVESSAPSSVLPEPTAPFSSPRPANLGERVIKPIDTLEQDDIARQIAAELNDEVAQANEPAPEAPAENPFLGEATDTDEFDPDFDPTPAISEPAPEAPAEGQPAAQGPLPEVELPKLSDDLTPAARFQHDSPEAGTQPMPDGQPESPAEAIVIDHQGSAQLGDPPAPPPVPGVPQQ